MTGDTGRLPVALSVHRASELAARARLVNGYAATPTATRLARRPGAAATAPPT